MRSATVIVLLACGGLAGQVTAFEGTATDAITGEKLSGVHLTLSKTGGRGGFVAAWGAISDKTGHFSIDSIPAGDYYMRAEKAGYVWFGPRDNREPGWISVRGKIGDFALTMTRESVIRGRVVDEAGFPMEGVRVTRQPASSDAFLVSGAEEFTNERGEFRIAGAPGKYTVMAQGNHYDWAQNAGGRLFAYYPSVRDTAQAKVVEAVAERVTDPIEIVLTDLPLHVVSGVVVGAPKVESGRTPEHTAATVFVLDRNGARAVARIGVAGEFKSAQLNQGKYHFYAWARDGEKYWRSEVVEERLDKDVADLRLRMAPVGALTGTVTGGANATRYTVTLNPVLEDEGQVWVSGVTDAASALRMDPPLPGRYRVEVSPMPADGYLKIEMNGAVTASGAVDVSASGSDRLQIAILPHAAQVSGKIVGRGAGPRLYWLYAVPDGADLDTARYGSYLGATFGIGNLPPGKYRLLTVDGAVGFGGDTGQLKKYADLFTEVEVKEGESVSLDLKILTAEVRNAREH
jgi:hypothetical protein